MFYVDEDNIGHEEVFVKSIDTDSFYDAKPSFYFGLNQEMGGLHANAKGCGLKTIRDEEKKTWMIIRTRMEIGKISKWMDTLSLDTWYQEGYKLYSPRMIECKDKSTGETVFNSTSWWIVMDLERMRPCRPDVFSKKLPFAEKSLRWKDPALPPYPSMDLFIQDAFSEKDISISYYDTDYNKHVNNISYVTWAMESFPKEFLDSNRPTSIDVKWEKQSFLGDTLKAKTFKGKENDLYMTKIYRIEPTGEELEVFTAVSEWTSR